MTALGIRRIEFLAVLLLLSISAYVAAPFSLGDRRLRVPPDGELDARQQTLLVSDSIDKLLTDPLSFYDTAVLYPDRHQLRTLEPILGYALLGLPLRVVLHLNDVDVFEASRWIIFFTCLTYAYLLFRMIGVDVMLSAAGAVLCVSQPGLLNDVGRLNIICMPLILPVVYHGLRVWTSGGLRHSVGLFIFAALYPLCGMVNATLSLMAVLFALPLLLKLMVDEQRQGRLAACLVPILLAALLDAAVTAPWLLDRSDLAVYVSDAFLHIKHWNALAAPAANNIEGFVAGHLGTGLATALGLLAVLVLRHRFSGPPDGGAANSPSTVPAQSYLLVVCLMASAVALSGSWRFTRPALPWLRFVFHLACFLTLLVYWRRQLMFLVSNDRTGVRNYVLMLSGGLGVLLCLMSFGPAYGSNDGPLANQVMRTLLDLIPPLRAVREFYRIWILGILFLSTFAIARLAIALRDSGSITRAGVAVLIIAAACFSAYNRTLIASGELEPPADIIDLASHSQATGGIYVHPRMQWNTPLGVWMIPIAKALGRPTVNGYLGIAPPWFGYASSVLHRFPDGESLWLLRKWKVTTVVSLGQVQGEDPAIVHKAFENGTGVIYEITAPLVELPHPSEDTCVAEGRVRIEGAMSQPARMDGGASVTVTVPKGFEATRVEIAFRQSVVEQMPESIAVYAANGSPRTRLNQGPSGDWIESLTANALLLRRSPIATIRVNGAGSGNLDLEFKKAARQRNTEQSTYASWWHESLPPIDRIGLCGAWAR